MMRRFWLDRREDVTGVSGTGPVAEGVQFHNGKCVLCWVTSKSSVALYDDLATLEAVHGHDGRTVVRWMD